MLQCSAIASLCACVYQVRAHTVRQYTVVVVVVVVASFSQLKLKLSQELALSESLVAKQAGLLVSPPVQVVDKMLLFARATFMVIEKPLVRQQAV